MTTQKTFKRRVRTRMAKTGESFTAARSQLMAKAERDDPRPTPEVPGQPETPLPAPPVEMPMSDEAIRRGTGRGWAEWFAILDGWDATARRHPEISLFIHDEHELDGWWAQSVTTGYERARGLRVKGERPGEGFTVNANRTVNVSVDRLSQAFTDDALRAAWLADAPIEPRTLRPGKSATFGWADPPSRLTVNLYARGDGKSQAQLQHLRLPDAATADRFKGYWRERLAALRELLQG
jgi:hypothetical protein